VCNGPSYEFIDVNGARIERTLFEDNVEEARDCVWHPAPYSQADNHTHCIVCIIAISAGDSAFQSGMRWLCRYCHTTYVERTS